MSTTPLSSTVLAHFFLKGEKFNLLKKDVGAYGASLSSNYNTRPKPSEYIITNGNIREIRSADTLDQILTNELK